MSESLWAEFKFPPINLWSYPKSERKFMYTIYSKADCIQCVTAKSLLESKGIPYRVLMLDEDYTLDTLRAMENIPRSFPVVVKDGTVIGSLNELKIDISSNVLLG